MSAPDDENVTLSATEVQSVQLIQTYTFINFYELMMSSQIKCVYVYYSVKVDNSDLSDELSGPAFTNIWPPLFITLKLHSNSTVKLYSTQGQN